MLEIMTGDRTYRSDTTNSRPKSPFQQCSRSLAAMFRGDSNSVGRLRVLEPDPTLLLNRMARQFYRDWALNYRRQRFRVISG